MKDTYFKIIGQQSTDDKLLILAVIPVNTFKDCPEIFETQGILLAPTMYTGTYPTIRVISDIMEDKTEEYRGVGAAHIITSEQWYIKSIDREDIFGVGL